MSFKPFDSEDVIVSADSISSTVWSTGAYELTTAFSSSTQEAATSGDYYLNVFHTSSAVPDAAPPMWNVLIVSCVPGSPIDWAATTPTASPI